MSRPRASSSSLTPSQQHQTTPSPARVQPPATSWHRRRVDSSPRLAEEKIQEVDKDDFSRPLLQDKAANFSTPVNSAAASSSLKPEDFTIRKHRFRDAMWRTTKCHVCSENGASKSCMWECSVCRTGCHQDCEGEALSCFFFETPKNLNGHLEEYCPDDTSLPKLPHLIVQCVQYLNLNTSSEGLYAVMPQDDREAETLIALVLREPNTSYFVQYKAKGVSQCILKFLNSLTEPLIPKSHALEFVEAANYPKDSQLKKAITNLPVVHKNVLSYLLLHWKLMIQTRTELTESSLGDAVLPVIFRITDEQVVAYFSLFRRLLALPTSFWCSNILKCPLEDPAARGAMTVRQQQPKHQRRGRLWC